MVSVRGDSINIAPGQASPSQYPLLPSDADVITRILQDRALHQPSRVACEFLVGGFTADSATNMEACENARAWNKAVLTYADLDKQARAIAFRLHLNLGDVAISGQVPAPRILLAFPPGLAFVAALFGCWYAGVIAVPVQPARRHQGADRWRHVFNDVQPAGVLTCEEKLAEVKQIVISQKADDKSVFVAAADCTNERALFGRDFMPMGVASDALALLQYTSGSTGHPKGVMVSHANLMQNLATIHQRFGHNADSRGVIWLPPHHDMGLIGGILQPVYSGFPVTLMSPELFLRQPIRWLRAISDFRATTSGGPNFAYEYCLQKTTPEQRQGLDLSSWHVAFTGAEPVRAKTLGEFSQTFSRYGFRSTAFYPCYGLAESTLFVAGGDKDRPPTVRTLDRAALGKGRTVAESAGGAIKVVSCGKPAEALAVVDPETRQLCQDDQIGEIWLSGPSVAQGYWKNCSATEDTFEAFLADGNGPYLRTGDLGFCDGQQLYVTGRLKDLIVIRGQNHYPQDIEQTVSQSHPALRNVSAAFSTEQKGEEQLVVFQEIKRQSMRSLDPAAIFTAVRAAVSQHHGLQIHSLCLLKPGQIPQTTSGKIQRHVCRTAFEGQSIEPIAQWTSEKPGRLTSSQGRSGEGSQRRAESGNEAVPSTLEPGTQNLITAKQRSDVDTLIQWLRDYARTSINSRLMDERRCLSPGVVLDFGNHGLLGMQVPVQYGGLGLGHQYMLRVLEQLGAIDPTLALFVGLNNVLGIRPILHSAQPDLKARLLPQLAAGRSLAAFALTEPGAGSHPLGTVSKAVPTAKGWSLSGQKIWSGSADWAGVINVFVQQQDASRQPVGMTGFVLEKGASGLRQGPEALTMGMRGMVQNAVFLENVPVDAAQMLGKPGGGMTVAQDAMMYGRLAIAAASVGGMKRCAQLMLRYSQRRTISTGRLLENPVTLTRLEWVTSAIAALNSLVSFIAYRLDREQPVPEELYAACKIVGPEFYWQAADHLMQCLGGRGYIETNLAPQILRDSRILRIFEGPTEALAMYLGSSVSHQSAALKNLFTELGLEPLASELFEAAERLAHHYSSAQSPFTEEITARRQANFAVGHVTAWAILRATLAAMAAADKVSLWAQQQFVQSVTQAMLPAAGGTVSSSGDLSQHIQSYQSEIGDVDQTLVGADGLLDDWLRPESANEPLAAETAVVIAETAPVQSSADTGVASRQRKEIEQWLVRWLAQRLQVSASQVEPDKALADYGIDSVMAVELAQDLEDFLSLSQTLDATLAWNFPTLSAISQHLAHLTTSSSDMSFSKGTSQAVDSASASAEEDSFDSFSDEELAEALAAELAMARGRRS